VAVELLGRPVVPRAQHGEQVLALVDREAEQRRGPVHDRRPDPVAVHVFEAMDRIAGPEARVLEAGHAVERGRNAFHVAAHPERLVADHPQRRPVALDDARPDLAVLRGQPLRPEIARHAEDVEVVVAGVDALVRHVGAPISASFRARMVAAKLFTSMSLSAGNTS
jgi:hypothetical protein